MLFLLYWILSYAFLLTKSQSIEVKVREGIVIGTREITVFDEKFYFAFYGVPYARIPVGRLRFKDPKPLKKWSKPFDARTVYRGACSQPHIVHKHAVYGFEDCLNLNIYTPFIPDNRSQLKSVIVWIHGYGFTSSFSHIHGGDFLIEHDVVFISVTYRIGVFGFLKTSDSGNANLGLKDIVMALKWIRRNVRKFGGDKDRITLMASGSAATFASLLMISKHKNLFSKVILQSGSLFSPSIFQGNPNLERDRLIRNIRCTNIDGIVKSTTKDIVLNSQNIYSKNEIVNFQRPVVQFTPIIENISNNSIITESVYNTYMGTKKIYINIPIMIGFNTQESISEMLPFIHNTRYLVEFNNSFKYMIPFIDGCRFNSSVSVYRDVAGIIKARYFKDGITEQSLNNLLRYASDLRIYAVYKFINKLLSINRNIYVYKFNYIGNFNAFRSNSLAGVNVDVKGVAEGDEICYILKCEPLWESYVKLKNNTIDRDRMFIKDITETWANFAKFGEPKQPWSPMNATEDNLYVFGSENKLTNSKVERDMYKFWNDIYNKYYAKLHCTNVHDEL
ncbi:esterase FE4-like [Battus philenor]|uniref:esterase FE4-like n=1 Tax=Battus philenor TaxID=42288 RepID=UPI0035CECA0D